MNFILSRKLKIFEAILSGDFSKIEKPTSREEAYLIAIGKMIQAGGASEAQILNAMNALISEGKIQKVLTPGDGVEISEDGVISFTGSGNGGESTPGKDGGYYVPSVSADGVLSWTSSIEGMPTIDPIVIRGPEGNVGKTPNIKVGTVTTLAAGSDATASITGTKENPVLNLGIPRGGDGAAATSPTIQIQDITGGHRVTITDATGPHTFDVKDGMNTEGGGGSFLIAPCPTKNIAVKFDNGTRRVGITFIAPADYILNGEKLAEVAGIRIVRKKDSEPENENDGVLVGDILRAEMFNYDIEPFIDDILDTEDGEIWFYKLFPYSTLGKYNTESVNTARVQIGGYSLFGFILDQNESDPLSNIEYIEDNANFAPAHMDYSTGKFDFGDWADAWFLKGIKPCMLKYNGTVDYLLDPSDYTKKMDGTPSDVCNDGYDGNAMVGIPTVWLKYIDNGDGTVKVLICDKNLDGTFTAYAHTDVNGNIMPYIYEPCYNGSLVSNKLRSLSGKSCMNNQSGTNEINYAKANNPSGSSMWYTEVFSDRQLINTLLMLIGKSTDTQKTFGNGHYQNGSSAADLLLTGTMDDKGLFWGSNKDKVGVKVFGIENYYGNQWRRIAGWINDNGTQRVKMTYGKQDGSAVTGYNTDGTGYISIVGATCAGTSGGYTKTMKATDYGLIPYDATGSDSTFTCDGLYFNNTIKAYALVGGSCGSSLRVGAFCSSLYDAVSVADWNVGAALSCKPPV